MADTKLEQEHNDPVNETQSIMKNSPRYRGFVIEHFLRLHLLTGPSGNIQPEIHIATHNDENILAFWENNLPVRVNPVTSEKGTTSLHINGYSNIQVLLEQGYFNGVSELKRKVELLLKLQNEVQISERLSILQDFKKTPIAYINYSVETLAARINFGGGSLYKPKGDIKQLTLKISSQSLEELEHYKELYSGSIYFANQEKNTYVLSIRSNIKLTKLLSGVKVLAPFRRDEIDNLLDQMHG